MSTTTTDTTAERIAYYDGHADKLETQAAEAAAAGKGQIAKTLRGMARTDRRTAANIRRRGH